jgi:hypothetical protein
MYNGARHLRMSGPAISIGRVYTCALDYWKVLAAVCFGTVSSHFPCLYVFSIARHIQKHQRLFSVLESMDNGKTFRETRDCDIPIVIRHFYHHAGWAQLADVEMGHWKSVGKFNLLLNVESVNIFLAHTHRRLQHSPYRYQLSLRILVNGIVFNQI